MKVYTGFEIMFKCGPLAGMGGSTQVCTAYICNKCIFRFNTIKMVSTCRLWFNLKSWLQTVSFNRHCGV